MKVLVTGGAGYVGSHACKQLARAGIEPVVYDNLSTGHRDAVRYGPLFEGDTRDRGRLDAAMAAHQPDCVIHFAASAYVGESVEDPASYYSNNVVGSLSLLESMRRHDVASIVFSSSCAVYGAPSALPIAESAPLAPVNPYGFTKLAVERMLADFGTAYGLRWTALRYFNAAGADPEGELGERHDPETHAVPLCIRAALGIDPSFSVFGSDYPTPDGSALRDYVHVQDLALAHVRALRWLAEGGASGVYNLGSGVATSVLEVVRAVERATGKRVPLTMAPRRAGDPPALYAATAKAAEQFGWRAEFQSIDDTVRTAAAWFGRRPDARISA
ncbi:MAG: UDP-glucose 4-epimerase GalE [Gammaproteobacteria bacterium]|nr:UDP-glucose 4-epimerase GalE [Gammaproteobacteria bacterium]